MGQDLESVSFFSQTQPQLAQPVGYIPPPVPAASAEDWEMGLDGSLFCALIIKHIGIL